VRRSELVASASLISAAVYPDREPVGSYRQAHRRPAGHPGPGPANRNRLLGIIAAAILAGGAMIARPGWLTWVTAGGLAAAAMTGYLLIRSLSGGFLGDHGDVGNWRCPLGITALSVEALIMLLTAGRAWQARLHAARMAAKSHPAESRIPESRIPGFSRSR